MNLEIAASLLLLVSAVAVFGVARAYVHWMYGAARASSVVGAVCLISFASALLFAVSLLPLVGLLVLASGTEWAESSRRLVLLGVWAFALAPGFWHVARHW